MKRKSGTRMEHCSWHFYDVDLHTRDCSYHKNDFFKFVWEFIVCHYNSCNYCFSEWKHCSFIKDDWIERMKKKEQKATFSCFSFVLIFQFLFFYNTNIFFLFSSSFLFTIFISISKIFLFFFFTLHQRAPVPRPRSLLPMARWRLRLPLRRVCRVYL